ncbi:MAG TPA: serine/threonine-protein kinase, partial [Usitatibacter sp.]|nr:serine/threonine-protein kinase [Usitatibacter sp.]
MRVSPELWARLAPLLDSALDMDRSAREAWLDGLAGTQPDLAPALRRLVEHHERAERLGELETVPRLVSPPPWSSLHAAGDSVGPFRLLRVLGHGGMGEVWLARQVDGRVDREVALKLPDLHGAAPYWRERFRRERDILARLGHPRIARLYDAGVTDAGQPWLAMEYVEGIGLAQYVERHALSIPQRLALFRQVLEAVAHAHRHLVVHRDLKPANILVDATGAAKLLDFGIAKLLDDATDAGADNLTRVGGRVMTLRYAAPEQIAAATITTSTDIYSLGVILHEVLTGLSPYRAVREGRPLTDVAILREEPIAPSRLALPKPLPRALAGDLDAIVLKALRPDPAHRYASVEAMGEDILAFLERRPVAARAGTWRYRATRFVARHRLPLAAAAAILLTLTGSLALVETERRAAVAQKARAERHFAS